MQTIAEIVLSNAAIATLLALAAAIVGRFCRRPPVVYGLWLLVLLKLVTPPLFRVPVAFLPVESTAQGDMEITSGPPEQVTTDVVGVLEGVDRSLPTNLSTHDEGQVARPAEVDLQPPGSLSFIPSSVEEVVLPNRAERVDTSSNSVVRSNRRLASSGIASPQSPQVPRGQFYWPAVVYGIWITGSIVWLSIALVRVVQFCREVRRPLQTNDELQRQVNVLAQRFGLRRPPIVKLVNSAVPPMLWAMGRRAIILLPRPLVERLSPQQQTAMLAHEVAHYCRRDHWVRWFEVLVLGLYWWHPVAWLARRELQRAEEQCCDAWVLWALPGAGQAYAHAILETVDFLAADCRPTPALASGLGPVHQLERRFEMILHARPTRRLTTSAQWALVLLGLVVLPLSATAQVVSTEPVKPADVATVEARPTAAQTATVAPVAEAATPADAPAVSVQAEPANRALPSLPVVATVEAALDTPAQSDTERRLQRLEKMMESILAELKNRPTVNPSNRSSRAAASNYVPSGYRVPRMTGSPNVYPPPTAFGSLADLKKQRIDIEEQLQRLQDDLSKLDDQIAKLQSMRKERSDLSPLQAK